jgi:hypothetical protein
MGDLERALGAGFLAAGAVREMIDGKTVMARMVAIT